MIHEIMMQNNFKITASVLKPTPQLTIVALFDDVLCRGQTGTGTVAYCST